MGVRKVNTEDQAREMFETFHAKPSKRKVKYQFDWPTRFQEAGRAVAQLYRSNKWKMDPREFDDYKHIAEAPQFVYIVPGFLKDGSGKKALPVYGDMVELNDEMPDTFTILAPLIGVQVRLYDENGKLPSSNSDKGLYEVAIPQGMLGGARFPGSNEAFLLVYTRRGGVHMIITGNELDVEKDGITG